MRFVVPTPSSPVTLATFPVLRLGGLAGCALLLQFCATEALAQGVNYTITTPITGTGNVYAKIGHSNGLDTITNNSTISATSTNYGSTDMNLQGRWASVTNSAGAALLDDTVGIYLCGGCGNGAGYIASVFNAGTIEAPGGGIFVNDSNVTFATITNIGAINAVSKQNGIMNFARGTIGTLNNYQGATGSGGTALTYTGQLPTNYNVIINEAHYGQLAVNPIYLTGTTSFNIYGNTGTTLVTGVAASAITPGTTYADVLQGFATLSGSVTNTVGTYDGIAWRLVADAANQGDWSLQTAPYPSAVPASAKLYGDLDLQALDTAQAFGARMLRHLDAAGCTPNGQLAGNAAVMAGTADAACETGRAWLQPFAAWGQTGGQQNGAETNDGAGVAGGVDFELPHDAVLGVAVQYSSDRLTAAGSNSSATIDAYQLGFYGSVPVGAVRFSAAALYFSTAASSARDTQGAGLARATPHGQGIAANTQAAYEIGNGDFAPLLALNYASYVEGAADETDAAASGLHVNRQGVQSLRADIGMRVQHSYQLPGLTLTPQLHLALEQELIAPSGIVSGSVLPAPTGSSFSIAAPTPERTTVVFDLNVMAELNGTFQLFADAAGRAGHRTQQEQLLLGGQMRF